jgi:hypothetical protein
MVCVYQEVLEELRAVSLSLSDDDDHQCRRRDCIRCALMQSLRRARALNHDELRLAREAKFNASWWPVKIIGNVVGKRAGSRPLFLQSQAIIIFYSCATRPDDEQETKIGDRCATANVIIVLCNDLSLVPIN